MTALHKALQNLKVASRELSTLPEKKINAVLGRLANELIKNTRSILAANQRDLKNLEPTSRFRARLELTPQKIKSIALDLKQVAKLRSPVNQMLEKKLLKNGLRLRRVAVPLGVVGVIYESRPNVTVDVFGLCFKTNNAVVLKGGKEALHTNTVLVGLIKKVLRQQKINPNCVHLITGGRAETAELLQAAGLLDVLIARGSRTLIDYVRANSRVPFIETGAAVCHIYFDKAGDGAMGARLIWNSKVSRPAVCNALDVVLIHKNRLHDLPTLLKPLATSNVAVRADGPSYQALQDTYPKTLLTKAKPQDFSTEFLGLTLGVKTVASLNAALQEISHVNGNHSESIVTKDTLTAKTFIAAVDAAAVYVNAATVFTDGGVFGLGAEVGISTQKLHARGPMGLTALTTYKWVVEGNGQIRP